MCLNHTEVADPQSLPLRRVSGSISFSKTLFRVRPISFCGAVLKATHAAHGRSCRATHQRKPVIAKFQHGSHFCEIQWCQFATRLALAPDSLADSKRLAAVFGKISLFCRVPSGTCPTPWAPTRDSNPPTRLKWISLYSWRQFLRRGHLAS